MDSTGHAWWQSPNRVLLINLREGDEPRIDAAALVANAKSFSATAFCISDGGIVAPAKTPRDIVGQLAAEIGQIVKTPATRDRLLGNDFEPSPMGPEEFGAFIRSEIAHWGKVIRGAKIRAE